MPQPTQYEEDEYWQGKINELGRTRLDTLRDSASKWTALITALLGIFAVVAFTGALPTLDKLDTDVAVGVKIVVLIALVCAVVATVLLAAASGNLFPASLAAPSPGQLKDNYDERADTAAKELKWGRWFGVAAALLVVVGSAVIFVLGEASTSKSPPTVVTVVNGKAICGKLGGAPHGPLKVSDVDLSSGVTDVVVVDACPG